MTHRNGSERPSEPLPTTTPPSFASIGSATINRVRKTIIDWFAAHVRPLPWRSPDTTPWGVLVSEIMSQQTPVARVAPRWLEWMERWPTPADLAQAPTAEVLRRWDRLGYPRRALRLQEAARAIVSGHDGKVPSTVASLEELPGIGHYTASAVASFAYGQRTTVLDTNVRRVLYRLFRGIDRPPSSPSKKEIEWASDFVPNARHVEWNAGVMEFGALLCTARSPRCGECPLRADCAWYAAGQPASATKPKAQTWAGTDRQLRGAIMAVLKSAEESVPVDYFSAGIAELDPDVFDALGSHTAKSLSTMRELSADAERITRLIEDLISDGLAEQHEDRLRLPS